MMKSLSVATALATLALFGVPGHAFAADVIAEAPPPPVFTWTGYYFGVQAGGGWGNVDFSALGVDTSNDLSGAYGGGHIAARWQFQQLTVGAEAEINGAGIDGSESFSTLGATVNTQTKVNWFGSVNGELGWALDRWLIYGTGGFAFGGVKHSESVSTPGDFLSADQDKTATGWTAGAGVDYAFTDNLILGVRYRYYDFGNVDFGGATDGTITIPGQSIDTKINTVSAKISYKF
ncbi:porin family protein [Mesorhizobium sp. BAC0120]|uniref:outer membrane protein n=1 Tax=Mesorhizobium sp. BAC0120 TaxID=3090670 RepID=UPI00298CB9D3|nr:outer membrane protein [Mesorhizobium sp. BAC0120]MDW6020285.1 porin family protein [Mesorhizobium sp. BAC0120]